MYFMNCVDVSHPGRNGMYYVTHISQRMQKKFDVTCPGVLFMEIATGPPEHEN
jgi:hypothetical protein